MNRRVFLSISGLQTDPLNMSGNILANWGQKVTQESNIWHWKISLWHVDYLKAIKAPKTQEETMTFFLNNLD